MSEHPAYPIYTARIKFSQDTDPTKDYHMDKDGLPEGREWDWLYLHNIMLKEPNMDLVKERVNLCWKVNKPKNKNVDDVTFDIKYLFDEEWCLSWFAHWTFDIGQTDSEAINSFFEFVCRMEDYNEQNSEIRHYIDGTPYIHTPYCLMGAQDRWRWKGDPNIADDPAPCRCKYCKDAGVLTIGH